MEKNGAHRAAKRHALPLASRRGQAHPGALRDAAKGLPSRFRGSRWTPAISASAAIDYLDSLETRDAPLTYRAGTGGGDAGSS